MSHVSIWTEADANLETKAAAGRSWVAASVAIPSSCADLAAFSDLDRRTLQRWVPAAEFEAAYYQNGRSGRHVIVRRDFMADAVVEALILDLLQWLATGQRSYQEVIEAWRNALPQ